MKNNFLFEILTPEKLVYSDSVQQVVVPAAAGQMTVLARHAPLIANVKPGRVIITTASEQIDYIIYSGFVQILENKTSLLVDSATLFHELDAVNLDERIEVARQALANSEFDHERNMHEDLLHQLTSIKHSLTV